MMKITTMIIDHDDDHAHQDECGSGARSGNAGFNVSWWKLPVEQRCPHLSTPELHVAQYKIQNTKYKIQNTKYKIQNTKYKIQKYKKYKNHLHDCVEV